MDQLSLVQVQASQEGGFSFNKQPASRDSIPILQMDALISSPHLLLHLIQFLSDFILLNHKVHYILFK